MRIVALMVFVMGIIYTVVVLFTEPEIQTPTAGWEVFIGILVILTGGYFLFQTRSKDKLKT